MSTPTAATGAVLGIDAGGSAARWQLDRAGTCLARGEAAAFNGHIFTADARAAAFAALDALVGAVILHRRPDAVVAGITGLDADTEEAGLYAARIADAFSLSRDRVAVWNDMRVAYEAAFGAIDRGFLVYAGTGSIGCHVDADGRIVRVGGRGVILDDAGSGFWIGKEALKAIFRAEDRKPGSGFATLLGRSLAATIGEASWNAARAFVYGGDRGRVARLAIAVASAAADGDPLARIILHDAGRELAQLALALIERLGDREIVLAGRASFLDPVLAAAFRSALPAGIEVRHERLQPVEAAAAMAARLATR